MEFSHLVRKRRMVRHFRPDPVSTDALDRILQAAQHAPSAGYTQGQSVVVVTEPGIKQEIGKICGEEHYLAGGFHPFISGAPVLLVICADEGAYHRRYQEPDKVMKDGGEIEWPVPYWHMDAGCTAMLVLLAAVDEGLDAGFAGAMDLDALRALLGIPTEVFPVGVIPIGYRAPDTPSPSLKRGRKPAADFVHRERW